MKQKQLKMSNFYCTQCGRKGIPVWRKKGAEREKGHLKKLFCLYCQKEVNCCEIKPFTNYTYDDFKLEFEYGNFDEEGTRIRTIGQLKEMIRNGKIEKVKNISDGGDSWIGENYLDK